MKEEVLKSVNFEDFKFVELSSIVRKSGLYSSDKIMERIEVLYYYERRKQQQINMKKFILAELGAIDDMKIVYDHVRDHGCFPEKILREYF